MPAADSLVYDLSNEVDGAAISPFLSRSFVSIVDDNAQNYSSGQISISSAVSANSNKWMSWREATLQVPLLITVSTDAITGFAPATAATAAPYAVSLKSFYGHIIHSMSVSLGGQVIVQNQPFVSVLAAFKLSTTLSYDDLKKNGSTIGFWPDDPAAFIYSPLAGSLSGNGILQ